MYNTSKLLLYHCDLPSTMCLTQASMNEHVLYIGCSMMDEFGSKKLELHYNFTFSTALAYVWNACRTYTYKYINLTS